MNEANWQGSTFKCLHDCFLYTVILNMDDFPFMLNGLRGLRWGNGF